MDKSLNEIKRLDNMFLISNCIHGYNESPELLFTYNVPQ